MSQENVEVVRRMYDAFHSGDADGALAHFDPDVVIDASKARPDVGVGQGREQVNEFVTSWVGTWEEWREDIEEMRDLAAGSSSSLCSTGGAGEAGLMWRPAIHSYLTSTEGRSPAWPFTESLARPSKPPDCRSSG
jgi:hypothetical protein